MESVAAFVWNGGQLWRGISGRIPLEWVAALAWNTQSGVRDAGRDHIPPGREPREQATVHHALHDGAHRGVAL